MRLRVLSDLHLEHFDGHRELPPAEADVVVLAGDIHRRAEGLAWARQQFPDLPILYVPGNHEFYGTSMPLLRQELALEAARYDIELLDNRSVTIGGVRFYGTTLWTDFALYADDPTRNPLDTEAKALRYMPDFRIITTAPGQAGVVESRASTAFRWPPRRGEPSCSIARLHSRTVYRRRALARLCLPPPATDGQDGLVDSRPRSRTGGYTTQRHPHYRQPGRLSRGVFAAAVSA